MSKEKDNKSVKTKNVKKKDDVETNIVEKDTTIKNTNKKVVTAEKTTDTKKKVVSVSKKNNVEDVSDKTKKVKTDKVSAKETVDNFKKTTKKKEEGISFRNSIIYQGVGRRKSAVSRAYLVQGTGKIEINGIDYIKYFKNKLVYYKVLQPLNLLLSKNDYNLKINVFGGGFCGQVEAIRLSIAICLSKVKLENRAKLKELGYLTTDSRVVERKKFGHKKARRSFQFTKR